eukprot:868307-Lingulodinium_polyedra.AAC.1
MAPLGLWVLDGKPNPHGPANRGQLRRLNGEVVAQPSFLPFLGGEAFLWEPVRVVRGPQGPRPWWPPPNGGE